MSETREQRRERKRAEARGIEEFREHIGNPAPLSLTPQAVYHWSRDDQADALATAREAEPDTGFVMRLLALCTLPRTNPGDRFQYIRTNGPWTLTLARTGSAGLPYGSLPRLLLAWICTEAVRTQHRTLRLGATLNEFMRRLGMQSLSGGPRSDRTRLHNQMERLFRAAISLEHRSDQGVHVVADLVANSMNLWWNPKRPDEPMLWGESTIELGEKFFAEIIASPVPLDMNVLKAMKRSPLGLDLYLWLTYRLFGLTEPLSLTWRQIYRQFGVNPKADRRTVDDFRKDVLRELRKLKDAWPALNYRTPRGCLELRPTRPLVASSRPGAANRRPGDTAHTALRRHVFRVLAERPELFEPEHVGELAETVKTAAARAGIPYEADTVTAAINAGRALAQAQGSRR